MVNDITITSLETITAFDILTGNLKFVLDELQDTSIANAEEQVAITGKGGRKLSTLKRNKAVTISGTNGMLSGGLMELQAGSAFENKATVVKWSEPLAIVNNTANTTFTAVGTSGNEISAVYVKNANGTLGKKLVQGASAAAGTFTYAPATKLLTFAEGDVSADAEVMVYYDRKVQADVLENVADKFSGKASLYIDALAEDKCSNVYRVQIYIPKADFSGEFSLNLGGDQTVHAFQAESLAGACGANGRLWTYTVFGTEAADVA